MAEPFDLDEAVDYINRQCDQAHPANAPSNKAYINCAGSIVGLHLSALPSGTLINSRVTGEFFKVASDHWVTTGNTRAHYTDADVATQVALGWDADLEQTDFNLIHMGE